MGRSSVRNSLFRSATLVRPAGVRMPAAGSPDSCAPDCTTETMCDSSGREFERSCCFNPDCSVTCSAWVQIGTC